MRRDLRSRAIGPALLALFVGGVLAVMLFRTESIALRTITVGAKPVAGSVMMLNAAP